MKMNAAKLKALIIGFLGLGLLTQYQNCAPAGKFAETTSSVQAMSAAQVGQTQDVGVIEPLKLSKIDLYDIEKDFVSSSQSFIELKGFCEWNQDGSTLGWDILNGQNERVAKGTTLCSKGEFKISLAQSEALACDQQYLLRAYFGARSSDSLTLRSHCEVK